MHLRRRSRREGLWGLAGLAMIAAALEGGAAGCGPPPPPEDACPGVVEVLSPGTPIGLSRSLAETSDDYQGYCAPTSGPDAVFTLKMQSAGTFEAAVHSDLASAVYASKGSECGDPRAVSACAPIRGGSATLKLAVASDDLLSVVIDSEFANDSEYDVIFSLSPAECGDGVVNAKSASYAGEECDFGPDGDPSGCDATCHVIAKDASADACPGPVIEVKKGQTTTAATAPALSSFTTGYADDYAAPGAGAGGRDRVFRLAPDDAGKLTIMATAGFDVVLYAYTKCATSTKALDGLIGVADSDKASSAETLTLEVPAGELPVYYLVVDGYDADSFGHFEIEATLE